MMEYCKYALLPTRNTPISATIALASTKSAFLLLSLHLTKVRIFASSGLNNRLSPEKCTLLGTISNLTTINRPEYS